MLLQISRASLVCFMTICYPNDPSDSKLEQFVEYYYKTFDENRQNLAPLYVRRHEQDVGEYKCRG
jgi:hypothetical protein